jgi:hypothetical protein
VLRCVFTRVVELWCYGVCLREWESCGVTVCVYESGRVVVLRCVFKRVVELRCYGVCLREW